MILSYRGLSYQLVPSAVPATQPPTEAIYRGVSYKLYSDLPLAAPNALTLRYRGVPYSLDPNAEQPHTARKSVPLNPALA